MLIGDVVYLGQDDLQEAAKYKPLSEVSIFDFKTSMRVFEKTSLAIITLHGKSRILKSRYTAMGTL